MGQTELAAAVRVDRIARKENIPLHLIPVVCSAVAAKRGGWLGQ